MKVLALDTSLNACSVALVDSATGMVLAGESGTMARGHAETLMPMVSRVMATAALRFSDIDRIAVTIGPGTFTGIRVGLAAARGLALAAGKPLIGIGTLEAHGAALAASAQPLHEPFAIALDARRGEVYLQAFEPHGNAIIEPCALAPDEAARRLAGAVSSLHGSGAALINEAAERLGLAALPAHSLPPGPDLMATARLAATRPLPEVPPAPLYLRAPDAKPQPGALARRAAAPADA
jgi:tRNA threonylcarbamoyladenosine biosynthesis protein TsaB